MPPDRDHYAAFYADKLWNLLPEVYRAEDAELGAGRGPLRELLDRVGAQVAVVRRSLDRAWADQSPETCDSWAVAYLGDLLATNVLPYLDDAARRLDVGKTIQHRRRKGTLAGLEELAADVTRWDVKVVEFFRRLARTRHNFDPPVGGASAALLEAQGLIGPATRTPAGGTADLRKAPPALRSRTAFDEFAHTADFRRGRSDAGWHGIAKLGVFVWRLNSYAVALGTPVAVANKPGCFTFDPSGRQVPLYAAGRRKATAFDEWESPAEWQLPGPISRELFRSANSELWQKVVAVLKRVGNDWSEVVLGDGDVIRPHLGTFTLASPPKGLAVSYRYGFAADIGAGGFDRRATGSAFDTPTLTATAPMLPAVPLTSVVELTDGRTFTTAAANQKATALTVRAANQTRAVLRLTADWVIEGTGDDATLVLDGLFVCGGYRLVLTGRFAQVTVRCCTLDPGTWDTKTKDHALAADAVKLAPTRLVVEGSVARLVVERSVLGPVKAAAGVSVFAAADSIFQAVTLTTVGGKAVRETVIDLPKADVRLTRCTAIGPGHVHRVTADGCILNGDFDAADVQTGCVRFTGWTTGSALPRKFESAEVPAGAVPFASVDFGRPDYGVLSATADERLRAGGEGGAEMGAFASALWPLKRRGLLAKFAEYLPIGLVPVVIDVT